MAENNGSEMAQRRTSVTITPRMQRQLMDLQAAGYALSMSEAIRIAVDRMWREEEEHIERMRPTNIPAT